MRVDLTLYCQLIGAMQAYHSKTTRSSGPAPEIRWTIGEDVRIIGFDDFNCQVRLSVARLNGESCHIPGEDSTDFFTEVPAIGYFDNAIRNTEVIIDAESSQSHLLAKAGDLEYKIKKVPYSEPLEFRQQHLPINRSLAEGSIQRKKLYQFISICPDDKFRVEVADGNIKFVSESIGDKVQYLVTDVDSISSESAKSGYEFGVEFLSEAVQSIPKEKQVQFFITEEFVRLRYKLDDIGYMNYYQRIKNSEDVYVI